MTLLNYEFNLKGLCEMSDFVCKLIPSHHVFEVIEVEISSHD